MFKVNNANVVWTGEKGERKIYRKRKVWVTTIPELSETPFPDPTPEELEESGLIIIDSGYLVPLVFDPKIETRVEKYYGVEQYFLLVIIEGKTRWGGKYTHAERFDMYKGMVYIPTSGKEYMYIHSKDEE